VTTSFHRRTTRATRALHIEPTPFTVTEVAVTASGSDVFAAGDILNIRQVGDQGQYNVNGADLLSEGSRYLLYVRPWVTEPGVPTGQHLIVGEQAAWLLGDDLMGRSATSDEVGRLTADVSELPAEVSVQFDEGGLVISATQ